MNDLNSEGHKPTWIFKGWLRFINECLYAEYHIVSCKIVFWIDSCGNYYKVLLIIFINFLWILLVVKTTEVFMKQNVCWFVRPQKFLQNKMHVDLCYAKSKTKV